MLLFGLTGGLASGKSTVAARFRERGLSVIDADLLAREVVAPQSEGLRAVVDHFGAAMLTSDGSLDRKRLASVTFGNDEARRALNAILHPRIARLSLERAAEIAARGEKAACYEAALLVENGMADAFRPLVVVAVSEAVQLERAMARDGSTEAEAKSRIAAQLPLADKVAVADFVIDNSGDVAATIARADEVLAKVLERAT